MSEKQMQVIKILDKFTVVINAGFTDKLHSIGKGKKVAIYEPGPKIEDIDGTVLGNYDFIKAELIITEVYPNFCIAKHLKEGPVFDLQKSLGGFTSKGPLDVEENKITPIKPKNSEITIGDLVKRI